MPRKTDISAMNCSLARALGLLTDPWAMLIVRDALLGATRFAEFRSSLGIARNVLAQRLGTLVEAGILLRLGTDTRPAYHLSEKGFELVPSLIGLVQWGDKWLATDGPPIVFRGLDGSVLTPIQLQTMEGQDVAPRDLVMEPGAGADARTRQMLTMRSSVNNPSTSKYGLDASDPS